MPKLLGTQLWLHNTLHFTIPSRKTFLSKTSEFRLTAVEFSPRTVGRGPQHHIYITREPLKRFLFRTKASPLPRESASLPLEGGNVLIAIHQDSKISDSGLPTPPTAWPHPHPPPHIETESQKDLTSAITREGHGPCTGHRLEP